MGFLFFFISDSYFPWWMQHRSDAASVPCWLWEPSKQTQLITRFSGLPYQIVTAVCSAPPPPPHPECWATEGAGAASSSSAACWEVESGADPGIWLQTFLSLAGSDSILAVNGSHECSTPPSTCGLKFVLCTHVANLQNRLFFNQLLFFLGILHI